MNPLSFSQTNTEPSIRDPNFHVAPGTIGPNAFTAWAWRVDDAKIAVDRVLIDLSYRYVKDKKNEWTHTGVTRIEVPFKELATLQVGYLFEQWKLNPEGYAAYQPETQRRQGFSVGDFIVGMKFNLKKENKHWPEITGSFDVKTASGGFEEARFTDSTGYSFNLLLAKQILIKTGVLKKIRFLAEGGFLCWDDGAHSQNDAYRFGVATEFEFKKNAIIKLGVQGFNGWEHNGDRPLTLYVEGEKELNQTFYGFGSLDAGLSSSANPITYSGGIRMKILRNYYQKMHKKRIEALKRELFP